MDRTFVLPTPHGDKITSLLLNPKLPSADVPNVEMAQQRYAEWTAKSKAVKGSSEEIIERMVELLNEYKLYIDMNLIFDSKDQGNRILIWSEKQAANFTPDRFEITDFDRV